MHDEIRKAFGQIRATEQMKQSVSEHLTQNRRKTAKGSIRVSLAPLVSACALLLLCVGIGNWYFFQEMPVSYVSVDVNPSVELTLNRRNRVTAAESRNKEGEIVLAHLELEGKDYLEAVELLVGSQAMQKYLTGDAELTVTVASSNAEELLSGLENSEITTHYHGMCRSADMDTVRSAHEIDMSLGKYQMYQLLSQYNAELTAEECQSIPMCQLGRLLAQYENGRQEAVGEEELRERETGCGHDGGSHHSQKGHHNGKGHHNVN